MRRGSRSRPPRRSRTAHSSFHGSSRGSTGSRSARRPSPSRSAGSAGSARSSITPSIIIAYIWIWAGFAMVVIAAGSRRHLARGARGGPNGRRARNGRSSAASPCRSSRRSSPSSSSRMLINVLKVFDIVISIAPGIRAGRRERARPRDVAHRFRRLERLRSRLRDRGLHLRPGDPGPACSTSADSGGRSDDRGHGRSRRAAVGLRKRGRGARSCASSARPRCTSCSWSSGSSGSCRRSASSSPRSSLAEDFKSEGWWQIFSEPSKLTFENYQAVFDNAGDHGRPS